MFGVVSHVVTRADKKGVKPAVSEHSRFYSTLLFVAVSAGLVLGYWTYVDVYQSDVAFDADDTRSIASQIGVPAVTLATSSFAFVLTLALGVSGTTNSDDSNSSKGAGLSAREENGDSNG